MPNTQGGKGYKKGTHENAKAPECDWDDGQQFGRVVKTLGNRRFRVLCNDMKERVCKLAGSLRRSQWCEEGCFVVLSLRGLSNDVGDILDIVEHSYVSKLKKDPMINKQLFGSKEESTYDDLFEEREENSEEESEEAEGKTVEEKEQLKKLREKKNKERDQQRSSKRDEKNEIDIDAI